MKKEGDEEMKKKVVRIYTLDETIRIMDAGQLPRKLSLLDKDMPLGLYQVKAKVEVYRVEEEEANA